MSDDSAGWRVHSHRRAALAVTTDPCRYCGYLHPGDVCDSRTDRVVAYLEEWGWFGSDDGPWTCGDKREFTRSTLIGRSAAVNVAMRDLWREVQRPFACLLRRPRLLAVVLAVLLAVFAASLLTGCTATTGTPTVVATGPAAQLAGLPDAPPDTAAPYNRDDWGTWTQHGHGCTTRDLVLRDQGTGVVLDAACRPSCPAAIPPCWTSPYDGVTTGDPAALQIDHLVPLAEAEQSGAADWLAARRHAYYNDPGDLVAVTAHANTAKGDRDPARWRPPVRGSWCAYATGWVAVKGKWGLSVDPAERAALADMLTACPAGTP